MEGEELERLLLGAVRSDDAEGLADATDRLAETIKAAWQREYEELVAGLAVAMSAAGQGEWLRVVDEMRALHEMDWEGFDRAVDALRGAFGAAAEFGFLDAVEKIVEAREALWDEAGIEDEAERMMLDLAAAARDPLLVERFGVEYRRDTAPGLAALVGIEPAAIPKIEDMEQLLSGRRSDGRPIEGRRYVVSQGEPMGSLELVFSADKSVSVTWGLASQEERRLIGRAHREAVSHAMAGIARQAGTVRTRSGGKDAREVADITWVTSHHRFSRQGDPQLHSHVSVLNVARGRETGRVRSLDHQQLHGYYGVAREAYHTRLAEGLRDLGLSARLERVGRGHAAVADGIPERVLRHFAGRTEEAERHAAEYLAIRHSVNFSELTPEQRSTWTTRGARATRHQMYYVASGGHPAWHARAEGQGYVPPSHVLAPKAQRQAEQEQQRVEERVAEVTRALPRKKERMRLPRIEQDVWVERAYQGPER